MLCSDTYWHRSLFLVETRDNHVHSRVESVYAVRDDAAANLLSIRHLLQSSISNIFYCQQNTITMLFTGFLITATTTTRPTATTLPYYYYYYC